jgi:hypothetical protein
MQMHLIKIIFLACRKSKTILPANQQHIKNVKAVPALEQLFKIIKLK